MKVLDMVISVKGNTDGVVKDFPVISLHLCKMKKFAKIVIIL